MKGGIVMENHMAQLNAMNRKVVKWFFLAFIGFGLSVILSIYTFGANSTAPIPYTEQNDLDYKVYLKNNDYYESEYVQDMEYISNLINYIDLNYNYSLVVDKKIDLDYSYNVISRIKVYNNEEGDLIYKKDETLVDEVHGTKQGMIQINEDLKINYPTYNDYVKEFRNQFSLFANSKLEVIMTIQVKDKEGKLNKSYSDIIEIPLGQQLVRISKIYEKPLANGKINVAEFDLNRAIFGGTSLFISILIFLVSIFEIITLSIMKSKSGYSVYQKTLHRIFNEYDKLVVNTLEVPAVKDQQLIRVTTFEELVDAADNLKKPILYTEVEKNKLCHFCVISDKQFYQYWLDVTGEVVEGTDYDAS